MKILWHTKKYFFLLMWQKIRYNFDWFTKRGKKSNYLSFLLQNDFFKSQVPILVYKDFWYQELTNWTQPYHVTWLIKCIFIMWLVYLWFKMGHWQWIAIVVLLAIVTFLIVSLREKRSVPLTKSVRNCMF